MIDNPFSRRVVGLDRCGRLFVAHLFQNGGADPDNLSGHDVEGAEFGFGGRGHDVFDNFGHG